MAGIPENFARGGSLLHRLDPRVKIVTALLYSVTVAVLSDIRVILAGLAFSVLLVAAARLNLRRLFARILVANLFIVFLWLFLPWTVEGEAVYRWGAVTITREGLFLALAVTLKANAIIAASIALLATSPLADIAHGLNLLRVPQKLVVLLMLTVRYIHLIFSEYKRLVNSAKTRAFRPRIGLRTYKTIASMFAILLLRSHDRADSVLHAMQLRGFSGRFPALKRFRLSAADIAAGFLITVFCVILGVLQWAVIP